MVTTRTADFQPKDLEESFNAYKTMISDALQSGTSADDFERKNFAAMLEMARVGFGCFVAQQKVECPETVQMMDGRPLKRFEKPSPRLLITVFGRFEISRAVYGERERQKAEYIPLDHQLQLPESSFSHLVQEWVQRLGAEHAYAEAASMLHTMLGLKLSVDSIESICRQATECIEAFQAKQPAAAPDKEAEILVATADHKGVPITGAKEGPVSAHRGKGQKPKKQMAAIGCVYSVNPHWRTAAELTEILFREQRPAKNPPSACQRRFWADLSHDLAGIAICAEEDVLAHMRRDVDARRRPGQTLVYLTDGQRSLRTNGKAALPADAIEVLDLMHVAPRLWEAAHVFHDEGSVQALLFVRDRMLRVLEGKASGVVAGLRQMATVHRLRGNAKKRLTVAVNFLAANLDRMRYDEYLAGGYPIATGVIEGACRHVIKDRMERTGMRWKEAGARAMLKLRTVKANDSWTEYHEFRIAREKQRLYSNSPLAGNTPETLAA